MKRLALAALWLAAIGGTAFPAAAEPLLETTRGLFAQGRFVIGSLSVRRGASEQRLTVHLHYRGPAHILARVKGSPRLDGNVALLTNDRLHVWFPRAELELDLPAGFGGERLFGSDFAMDDLLVLAGDPQHYAATDLGEATLDGVPCRRVALRPREPQDPRSGTAQLWISADGGLPLRLEALAPDGAVQRVVRLERGPDGRPSRLVAHTPGAPTSESVFAVLAVEADPRIPARYFTPEGLRAWP